MGGKNEQVVETVKNGFGQGIGKVRIHQSGGYIHFHNDERKIKAAVPVFEFWPAWNRFKNGDPLSPLKFVDVDNRSILTITTVIAAGTIDVTVDLDCFNFGDTFATLNSFAR